MNNTQQEGYAERLTREVEEIKAQFPGAEKLINGIIKAHNISEMDIDYAIERTRAKYRAFEEYQQKFSSPLTPDELKTKFAQHLGVEDLDTSDAYAVEWVVKELNKKL